MRLNKGEPALRRLRGQGSMRSMSFAVLLLLAATAVARGEPGGTTPPMSDPRVEAPNLPFCP